MTVADELVRAARAHHATLVGLQNTNARLIEDAWNQYANLDDVAAARFAAAASTISGQAVQTAGTFAAGVMRMNDELTGHQSPIRAISPTIRQGIPLDEVYRRSIVEARRAVARGADYNDAMDLGRARAIGTARTDVTLANRQAFDEGAVDRPWVVGYRRVLTGLSCALCATASTQRYRRAELMPIHARCDCDVAEIIGTTDPGRIIDRQPLDDIRAQAEADGVDRYWHGPYVIDPETGAIHYRQLVKLTDADGAPVLLESGKQATRVVAGERVEVSIARHGELGEVLTDARHSFTAEHDLAPEVPEVVPAERKARRRYTVDDDDVRAAAERAGVSPDEVLVARTRVREVRRTIAEEAARVQADTFATLDGYDTLKVRRPPLATARSGSGSKLRRGEYDWLEQLDPAERARLSRKWYSDAATDAPDQLAERIARLNPRAGETVDDALEHWLDLTRRHEAAGAIRRGKLPSDRAYSGAIDPNDLLPAARGEGYDVVRILGDDLDAAAHIAAVEREALAREAQDDLSDALNPVEGPAPYRMGFQTWEEAVRDLEYLDGVGDITAQQHRRLAELVPEYLDEPGTSYEELYARIVTTARRAGEEVPDHAVIPWA